MKKIVMAVLVLALVGASAAFAQEWDIFGGLGTGFRLGTFGGGRDWDGPVYEWTQKYNDGGWMGNEPVWMWSSTGERTPYPALLSLFNADDGNYVDLKGVYTNSNYGFYGSLRFHFFGENPFELAAACGWVNLLRNTIKIKIGRVRDEYRLFPIWSAPGAKDCEYNYSTGDGIRIEFKGIRRLSIGIAMFFPVYYETVYTDTHDNVFTGIPNNYYKQMAAFGYWTELGINAILQDFFMNTAFAGEYENKDFKLAAGLKLDSKADNIENAFSPYFGQGLAALTDGPGGTATAKLLLSGMDPKDVPYYMDKGMKAYAGLELKMFRPINIILGGHIKNLGAFSEYGMLNLNQSITYNLGWKYGGINLSTFQTLFFVDKDNPATIGTAYEDAYHTKPKKSTVVYTFTPSFFAFWTGHSFVSIKVPVSMWPNIVTYDIAVNPSYMFFSDNFLGKGISFSVNYKFIIIQFSKYSNNFVDSTDSFGRTLYRNSDPIIKNEIQFNFGIAF